MINFIDEINYAKNRATQSIMNTCNALKFNTYLHKDVYAKIDLKGKQTEHFQEQIIVAAKDQKPDFHNIDVKRVNSCCILSGCPIGIGSDKNIVLQAPNKPPILILTDDKPILDKWKQNQYQEFRKIIFKNL